LAAGRQLYLQLWKEIRHGRVLLLTHTAANGTCVYSSPFGAVDKLNPDRSIAEDKRVVHDQRGVNSAVAAEVHPPALQPRHRQLARLVLHWKSRFPMIRVLLAKKDIKGAFRLLWVKPEDCELFGGEVPWRPQEMGEPPEAVREGEDVQPAEAQEENGSPRAESGDAGTEERDAMARAGVGFVTVFLVLSFGFQGAPGEWMPWAAATKQLHEDKRPALEERDGPDPFADEVLMDDAVLVEPLLGFRPWVSRDAYEHGVRQLLGPDAINAEKDALEGEFDTARTCWGVDIDTETDTIRIPERRILKGAHLMALPCYDSGNKDLSLLDVQRARGTAQSWAAVLPSLHLELKAADVFLGPADAGGRAVCAAGVDEQEAWEDLWDFFEYLRLLCARPEVWEARFQAGLDSLLTPRERLALPGAAGKVVFVSSDATLEKHAACDWTFGVAAQAEVVGFLQEVRRACGSADDKLIIALGELLGLVAFAAQRAEAWRGRHVIYGGDNQVVLGWLRSRAPRNRNARHILRVMAFLELRWGFRVIGGYVRTYHNTWPDFFSRCTREEFRAAVQQRGWNEVDLVEPWAAAVRSAVQWRVPVMLGQDLEDDAVATQLRLRRASRLAGPRRVLRADVRVEELGSGPRDFEAAWTRLQEAARREPNPRPQLCAPQGPTQLAMVGSLGPDRSAGEAAAALKEAVQRGAAFLLLEGPEAQSPERVQDKVKRAFEDVVIGRFATTEFGEALYRRRWFLFASREPGAGAAMLARLAHQKLVVGPPCGPFLRPRRDVGEEDWIQPERLVVDPRAAGAGGPLEPRGVGHLWMGRGRELLLGTGGPLPFPRLVAGQRQLQVVYDIGGPPGCVRRISDAEVCALEDDER